MSIPYIILMVEINLLSVNIILIIDINLFFLFLKDENFSLHQNKDNTNTKEETTSTLSFASVWKRDPPFRKNYPTHFSCAIIDSFF